MESERDGFSSKSIHFTSFYKCFNFIYRKSLRSEFFSSKFVDFQAKAAELQAALYVLRVLPEGVLDGAELAVGDVEEVDEPSC